VLTAAGKVARPVRLLGAVEPPLLKPRISPVKVALLPGAIWLTLCTLAPLIVFLNCNRLLTVNVPAPVLMSTSHPVAGVWGSPLQPHQLLETLFVPFPDTFTL